MQPSPKKFFKNSKTTPNPKVLLEPNSNERYIQNHSNFPQISNFSLYDNIDGVSSSNTAFGNLVQNSFFPKDSSGLFDQSLIKDCFNKKSTPNSKPYKILDAPDLQDNFYYNILDWGSKNIISVALSTNLYLFDVRNCKVLKLYESPHNATSLKFNENSQFIAVGSESGRVLIFDVTRQSVVQSLIGHSGRVGVIKWNGNIITTGGFDTYIIHSDMRVPAYFSKTKAHKEEICGLEWDGESLASGSNDNIIKIWDKFGQSPSTVLKGHTSAVKSMAWSPNEHKVLVSGGGANDKKIITWNTLTGKSIFEVDSGSQVCSLLFSKNTKEIITGHGYMKHEISIWNYPDFQHRRSFRAHDDRVLYMALSPDCRDVVTGAGDKTLRFWHLFDAASEEYSFGDSFWTNIR